MTTPERNPEITRKVGEDLRTIWQVIEFVTEDADERGFEIGLWMEHTPALTMVQEMLTDLSTTGLMQIEHYLQNYARYDDIPEVEAAAQYIREQRDSE